MATLLTPGSIEGRVSVRQQAPTLGRPSQLSITGYRCRGHTLYNRIPPATSLCVLTATIPRSSVTCHCIKPPQRPKHSNVGPKRPQGAPKRSFGASHRSHAHQKPHRKGPQLRKLLSDINACTSSPQALKMLENLKDVPKGAVRGSLDETVQCIDRMMQQASSGSVRNIPKFLLELSKVAKKHSDLLRALQKEPYRSMLMKMFDACAEDLAMYRNSFLVSQICCAQYNLQLHCVKFWQTTSTEYIAEWKHRACSSFVYGYGQLYKCRAAPVPSKALAGLLRDAASCGSASMTSQGAANTMLAFATLKLPLGVAHQPMMKAVVREACKMKPQGVANTLWAFAKLKLPLGEAHEPLMKAVLREAGKMEPQNVSNTLWAFATLELPLGEAHHPLMEAVLREACKMKPQGVSNTLWALATLELPLGEAHQPLMEAVRREAGDMIPQNVSNTLWAFATLKLPLEQAHQPLMKAVVREACKMKPQEVANTLLAFAKLELPLGEAHQPLMKAVLRTAGKMEEQNLSNTIWAVGCLKADAGVAELPLFQALVRVSPDLTPKGLNQVLIGLKWLAPDGARCPEAASAWKAVHGAQDRLQTRSVAE